MKIKKIIDGKEVEIELSDSDIKGFGLISQTSLLENDELFNEALSMRGVNVNKKSKGLENSELKELAETVKSLQEALGQEREARVNATKSLEEKAKRDLESKIETDLTKAVESGKITPEQKDAWKTRLSGNYDEFSQVLNELPSSNNGATPPAKKEIIETKGMSSGDPILDAVKDHNNFATIIN